MNSSRYLTTPLPNGNPAGASPGGGPNATPQGKVNVAVNLDYSFLEKASKVIGPTIWPATANDECRHVAQTDVLLQEVGPGLVKDEEGNLIVNVGTGVTKVFSSLNGVGADAAMSYPDDPDMQLLAFRNQVKFAGISRTGHIYKKNDNQGFAAQHRGIFSVTAVTKTPVGFYAQVRFPPPSDFYGNSAGRERVVRQGIPPAKATAELVPYLPETVGARWKTIMGHYLRDRKNFMRAFGARHQRTEATAAAADAQTNFVLVSFLSMLNALVKKEVITWQFVQDSEFQLVGDTDNATSTENLLALARGIGIISDPSREYPQVLPLTAQRQTDWAALTQELLRGVFYDGSAANTAITFDMDNTGRVLGRDPTTGQVLKQNPFGQLFTAQLNSYRAFLSAVNAVMLSEHEWIVGKWIKGATTEATGDILM
jgi:hypothetical protein